jgi:hypothetical protein
LVHWSATGEVEGPELLLRDAMSNAIDTDINLYDSEVLQIGRKVLPALQRAAGRRMQSQRDYESFGTEVTNRFAEIGLIAHVVSWKEIRRPGYDNVWSPQISIMGRINPEDEHDHEKHRWEVQRNVLGKDQPAGTDAVPVAMPGGKTGPLWTPRRAS